LLRRQGASDEPFFFFSPNAPAPAI
jgi:hypothetical protein